MEQQQVTLNGRYQLLERVGSGGMSVVYKARDRALGRLVAVKIMHESLTNDAGFLARFQREAHAVANLSHSNIVTVHDIGQDRYKHYLVMEFVEGQTLKQLIRAQNETGQLLPISQTLDLAIQICNGIGYAHRAQLVHCDVKSQNVLVTAANRIKVADFGIARAMTGTLNQADSQVWGSPQYFSPEQATGTPPTPASDVYSIGIILFEMLSGRLPFTADSYTALAMKHARTPPPPISDYNPAVPQPLAQILNKVLAKEPAGRYRTAGQLGRILSTYRQQSQAETAVFTPPAITPVSEQKTEIYQRPTSPASKSEQSQAPARAYRPTDPAALHQPTTPPANSSDWTALALGITAVVALLGLIPLWYFVYQAWAG